MTKVLVEVDTQLWQVIRSQAVAKGWTNTQLITQALIAFIKSDTPFGTMPLKEIERRTAPLMPERTGMLFAAAKRENTADVGPERPSVANGLPPSSLVSPSRDSVAFQVGFHPVPKPARKK